MSRPLTHAELLGRLYLLVLRADGQHQLIGRLTKDVAAGRAVDGRISELIDRARQHEKELEALKRDLEDGVAEVEPS